MACKIQTTVGYQDVDLLSAARQTQAAIVTMDEKPKYEIDLPEPWHWITTDFSTELYHELPHGHILAGKSVRSVARRQDRDDFLFEIIHADFQYAVVHLTWQKETKNLWPVSKLYKNWNDVYENRILPDSLDFN